MSWLVSRRRGDFQLSLFGYDFGKDHKAITNDSEHRIRVDLENPAESLFIQKPLKQVKHKGGEIYDEGSWEHNVMLKWIQDGAKLDVEETGAFDRLEVFPKEFVGNKVGDTMQLKVLAYWQDGTVEDVTDFTRFDTNDESVATVNDLSEVRIVGKGDSHVVAFYDNGVLPLPVMLPVSDQVGAKYPKVKANTPIDKAIATKLQKVGIVPSDLCTDQEFLRRVTLDVTGTLPTAKEVKDFLASKDSKKRQKKVNELLARPAYAAWWTTKLNDFQGNSPQQIRVSQYLPRDVNLSSDWYNWVYKRVLENKPYDEIVEGIVLASGRSNQEQSFIDYAKEMGNIIGRTIPRISPSARTCRGSGPGATSASRKKRRWPLPIASSVCASSALSATSTRLTNGHKPTSTRSRPSLNASPWAAKTYRRTRATTTATSPISCARWPTTIPRIRPKT